MNLIVSLNESVRAMGTRFDTFQRQVDDRLTKLANEQILLKSKVDFLEHNCMPKPVLSSNSNPILYNAPQDNNKENNWRTAISSKNIANNSSIN